MSTSTPSRPFEIAEPIPGYHMQERIGAGGYGEVWRATAPGGIAKAIKVIYGCHDNERATRELNALNRIKEVRHPFLLSLERIELADGHLVIVTELATASMRDLFEQYCQAGLVGIPRADLLGHLRDAGDALDYICQEHSLQHLDVKPENLLLVGGRIKVADFGLVKDLQDASCSIIGGLTPVYAAPELFDGRPSDRSDQYSLAIVYQEMLTGVLPHDGRTTAQLAAQHLHSRPRLDRLPASDQATIAKALSKDPGQRFASCRDMVDSLLETTPNHRSRIAVRTAVEMSGLCCPPPPQMKTEVLPRQELPAGAHGDSSAVSMTQPTEPAPAVRDLPPLELRPDENPYRPTIFIGIGGLAAQCLQGLHRRLVDRFGDIRAVPALQLLLFETDSDTLKAVTEGDETPLGNDATLLLPLRQAASYRRESGNHLQWLSRRWIYNIPRALKTQGFRPLGRLALIDHIERVMDRIERAIKMAVDREALAASAQKTGLRFDEAPPRIFIVSSISGGTGSGMVLDIGYLVRKVLRDLHLSEDGLCGILAHCTGRNRQGRDLAVANAYSLLSELHHYSDPHHAYPGDPACGVPSFAAEDAPFTHTYMVHLGEDLEQKDFTAAAEKLAKYLYFNSGTSAGAFFDACRAAEQDSTPLAAADPPVRTFGLCQLGFSYDDIPLAAADELCEEMVTRWRGAERAESADHAASLSDPTSLLVNHFAVGQCKQELHDEVAALAEGTGLHVEQIVNQLQAAATHEMGDDLESYLLVVLGELVHNYRSEPSLSRRMPPNELIIETLDSLICSREAQAGRRICLESALEKHIQEIAAQHAAALQEWILGLIASPEHRIQGAQRATGYVAQHLRGLGQQASTSIQAVRRELHATEGTLLSGQTSSRSCLRFRGFASRRRLVADRPLSQYFRLKIDELTFNSVCRLTGLILAQIATLDDTLRNLAADLNRLAGEFHGRPQSPHDSQDLPPSGSAMASGAVLRTIREQKVELAAEMERALESDLRRIVAGDHNEIRRELSAMLRRTARATILRALKKVTLREIAACSEGHPDEAIFSLGAGLKAAMPRLLECGGDRRLLLLAPATISPTRLIGQLGDAIVEPPTTVPDPENEVLLCYELGQLSLQRVAAAVLDHRFQNVEIASRLHTRIDVPWSPL
jgi:eukaryotic-like serine/threonine-protein kinase